MSPVIDGGNPGGGDHWTDDRKSGQAFAQVFRSADSNKLSTNLVITFVQRCKLADERVKVFFWSVDRLASEMAVLISLWNRK